MRKPLLLLHVSGDDIMPDVPSHSENGSFTEATALDGLKYVLKV